MRVSDTERQRAIDELRRHCAAGRLDVDEYATRIEAALAATTLEDLDRVLGDLPMLRIADPAEAAAAGSGNGSRRRRGAGSPPWGTIAGQPGSPGGGRGWTGRLAASAVVVISVLVVLGAVALAAVVGWSWAAVLLGGWLLGLVQSRLSGRGHRDHWR
ncbi:MAG TPA: DUF1707 domain-containing protein [Acidimicrobiales bacterium]|jgi:hypothetical protein